MQKCKTPVELYGSIGGGTVAHRWSFAIPVAMLPKRSSTGCEARQRPARAAALAGRARGILIQIAPVGRLVFTFLVVALPGCGDPVPESPTNLPELQLPVFTGPPDQRPSADEWEILWNPAPPTTDEDMFGERDPTVDWDDALPTKEEAEAMLAEYTLVYSAPAPLPYDVGKHFDSDDNVKEELLKVIPAYLESAKIPLFDEYGHNYFDHEPFSFRGEVSGHFEPLDRTIEIPLLNPDIFTPGMVRHIQATVLQKYPLWRIQVVATTRDGERSLTIYSDVVRFGDTLAPPAEFGSTVTSWQEQIRRIREPVEGPKRRQALYVRSLLPDVLPTVPENGAALIAVFDNWRGNYEKSSVWIAYDGSDYSYNWSLRLPSSVESSKSLDNLGHGGEFFADFQGHISKSKGDMRFNILNYIVPFEDELELSIEHKEEKSTQQFTIRRSEAITDAELKRLLGEE